MEGYIQTWKLVTWMIQLWEPPSNSTSWRFPSYLLLTLIIYFLFIFYHPGAPYRISFLFLPSLPCHFYLVFIEQQRKSRWHRFLSVAPTVVFDTDFCCNINAIYNNINSSSYMWFVSINIGQKSYVYKIYDNIIHDSQTLSDDYMRLVHTKLVSYI